jgi:hypothetical protein
MFSVIYNSWKVLSHLNNSIQNIKLLNKKLLKTGDWRQLYFYYNNDGSLNKKISLDYYISKTMYRTASIRKYCTMKNDDIFPYNS